MKSVLDLNFEGKIHPAFVRANGDILSNNSEIFDGKDAETSNDLLEALWNSRYNTSFIKDDTGKFKAVEFKSQQDKMLFLLKWS